MTFGSLGFAAVTHRYDDLPTLGGIDFTLSAGEFVTVIGPSGCGKSTLFNLATGLIRPTGGDVLLNGEPLAGINPYVAYMFQSAALLEWRNVLDNITVGRELLGESRAVARQDASRALNHFGLAEFARHMPWELSGGMKQRAALLRTYLTNRPLLLLDEPFGALDALTRLQMQQFLLDTWQEDRRTVLFVTHDVEEALLLGDRVIVLTHRPARVLEEVAVPFQRPRSADALVGTPEFTQMKRKLLQLLHSELQV